MAKKGGGPMRKVLNVLVAVVLVFIIVAVTVGLGMLVARLVFGG